MYKYQKHCIIETGAFFDDVMYMYRKLENFRVQKFSCNKFSCEKIFVRYATVRKLNARNIFLLDV